MTFGFLLSLGSYSTYQIPSKEVWYWSAFVSPGCIYCSIICAVCPYLGLSLMLLVFLSARVWPQESGRPERRSCQWRLKAKKAMSTSCFPVLFIFHLHPCSAVSSLWSSVCWCCTCEALVAFYIPHHFRLHLSFDCPDSISACLGSGSVSFLGGLSVLPPPACFVFAIELKSILQGLSSVGWIKVELQHVTSTWIWLNYMA